MDPKFFVDAAGIPRAVTPNNPLQTLQRIGGKFANAIDPLGPLDDLGSAVNRGKVGNMNQIRQYEQLLPTPYDIRMERSVRGTKAPSVPTPKAAPGSVAPKVVMNKPGVAGASVAAPVVKPGMMPQVSRYLPRAVAPLIDAGMQIKGGANPYDAAGRALFGGVGGAIGSAGTAFLGAEPLDPITSSIAGYKVGYDQGVDLYEKIRGYKPSKPIAPSASDMMSGKKGPAKPKRGLSTLQPGDDIPLSQYPEGVPLPTGRVGGGNAGGAQSVDPEASGYIPPTGEPLSVERPAGRDLSRPSLTYGSFSENILQPMGITPGMYAENRTITEDGADVAAFAADSGFSKPEAAAILGGGSVETVIDGSKPMETTINEPKKRGLSGLDAGSRAFLDYEGGSMGALRARDEALNLVYQGQNYYAIDRDADPTSDKSLVKLTEDQRRDITNRKSTAQDFLKSRVEGVKAAQTEVPTPAAAQDPVVVPEGFNELSLEDKEAAFNKQREGVAESILQNNPQGIENPTDAAMRDAIFLERKAKGLPF